MQAPGRSPTPMRRWIARGRRVQPCSTSLKRRHTVAPASSPSCPACTESIPQSICLRYVSLRHPSKLLSHHSIQQMLLAVTRCPILPSRRTAPRSSWRTASAISASFPASTSASAALSHWTAPPLAARRHAINSALSSSKVLQVGPRTMCNHLPVQGVIQDTDGQSYVDIAVMAGYPAPTSGSRIKFFIQQATLQPFCKEHIRMLCVLCMILNAGHCIPGRDAAAVPGRRQLGVQPGRQCVPHLRLQRRLCRLPRLRLRLHRSGQPHGHRGQRRRAVRRL